MSHSFQAFQYGLEAILLLSQPHEEEAQKPLVRAIHTETYNYNYKKNCCQLKRSAACIQINVSVFTVKLDNDLFYSYSYSYRSQCEWPFSQKHLDLLD